LNFLNLPTLKLPFKIPVGMKNRTVVGAACIIVGLIAGFVLFPLAANSGGSSVTIVRAAQTIPAGIKITDAMLTTVSVGKKNLPSNELSNKADAIGKYAAVTITAQDDVTSTKFSTTGSIYSLTRGQQLISVGIKNFADSLSGKLQGGDVVSVFFPPASNTGFSTSSTNTDAQLCPELQYVKVVAVTSSNGGDTDEATIKKNASSGTTNSNLPATVTLLVNDRQAQILAGHENDTAHFTLRCRSDNTYANALLKEQQDYFDTLGSSSAVSASSQPVTSSTTTSGKKVSGGLVQ
jgi:pilus assembly protein CpaB